MASRRVALLGALCVIVVLTLVACGDGGSDGSSSAAGTTGAQTDQAGSDGDATGGNYATVTIGENVFEVPADALNGCNSLDNLIFGSFAVDAGGNVVQAGGPDAAVQINFALPVTDWEAQGLQPPNVIVDEHGSNTRWIASVDAGSGSVDTWELSDGRATGSATFVVQEGGSGNETGTETGTFEIVCR